MCSIRSVLGRPSTRQALIRRGSAPAMQGIHGRSITLLAVCAISVAALSGPAAVSGAPARSVTLKNIAFSPKKLSISRGTTVTFRWSDDGTTHNVTSKGTKRIKTIPDRSTGAVGRKFAKPGAYAYECTLHPGMTGQITVR